MTAQIIRLDVPANDASDGMTPEQRAFCLARRGMNIRLLQWLRAGGDPAAIGIEVGFTSTIMQQLIELERG